MIELDDVFDLFRQELPALSLRVSDVSRGLQGIARALADGDEEMASSLQERMHLAVLSAVAEGHRNSADLARAAHASRLLFQAHTGVRSAVPIDVFASDAPEQDRPLLLTSGQIRAAAFREAAEISESGDNPWWCDRKTQHAIAERLRAAAEEPQEPLPLADQRAAAFAEAAEIAQQVTGGDWHFDTMLQVVLLLNNAAEQPAPVTGQSPLPGHVRAATLAEAVVIAKQVTGDQWHLPTMVEIVERLTDAAGPMPGPAAAPASKETSEQEAAPPLLNAAQIRAAAFREAATIADRLLGAWCWDVDTANEITRRLREAAAKAVRA